MAWSKRELVEDMYAELALAGYAFDLPPEEMQAGLRRMDTMLATWASLGIDIGYAFGLTPSDTSLDQDSGLPLAAVEAVVLNGAIRLAAGKGKTLARSTAAAAKAAYDSLVLGCANAQMQEQQLDSTVPRGAGNKPFRAYTRPFMPTPDEGALVLGADGGLTFDGT